MTHDAITAESLSCKFGRSRWIAFWYRAKLCDSDWFRSMRSIWRAERAKIEYLRCGTVSAIIEILCVKWCLLSNISSYDLLANFWRLNAWILHTHGPISFMYLFHRTYSSLGVSERDGGELVWTNRSLSWSGLRRQSFSTGISHSPAAISCHTRLLDLADSIIWFRRVVCRSR
jgi:hypothetical protein